MVDIFPSTLSFIETLDHWLWGFFAAPCILLLGIFLTVRSRFFQAKAFSASMRLFFSLLNVKKLRRKGEVHPLKAFFTCIGGGMGIGNVVAICTAIQIGGPGALFWIWVCAFFGMIIKYSEVFLGLKMGEITPKGKFLGGPMFFLQRAFPSSIGKKIAKFASILLCIYGIEIYQFNVVATSLSSNFNVDKMIVALALLGLVVTAGIGGVRRVGRIASFFIPLFIVGYLTLGSIVLFKYADQLPSLFHTIFTSAFTGHATLGGFLGSTLLLTFAQGIKRGCYTSDLGVGFASIIHSESSEKEAEKQALLTIVEIFVDSFLMCTMSTLLILITGVWKDPIDAMLLVQNALSTTFPYMDLFIPFFLLLLGYTTITSYFTAGIKCAEFLSPKHGKFLYFAYALMAMFSFSFLTTNATLLVMSLASGMLLLINGCAIFSLRNEISFDLKDEPPALLEPTPS